MMTNEELLALLKKNPIGVVCAVLSLALGAGIYFRSDEVPAAEAELAQKSEEGARLAANLQNATQLKEQSDALAVAEKELEARLMHASQTLTNLQFFYKLETDTGVKMTVNSQGPLTAPPKNAGKTVYSIVPFTITVQGTIAQLIDYLHRLESNARYCRVMSITCSAPSSERGAPITLALNLELLGVP
jgi:hypothetical protein